MAKKHPPGARRKRKKPGFYSMTGANPGYNGLTSTSITGLVKRFEAQNYSRIVINPKLQGSAVKDGVQHFFFIVSNNPSDQENLRFKAIRYKSLLHGG